MNYKEKVQLDNTYLSLTQKQKDVICKDHEDCRNCPMKCIGFGFNCGKILSQEQAYEIAKKLDNLEYNGLNEQRFKRLLDRMCAWVGMSKDLR